MRKCEPNESFLPHIALSVLLCNSKSSPNQDRLYNRVFGLHNHSWGSDLNAINEYLGDGDRILLQDDGIMFLQVVS